MATEQLSGGAECTSVRPAWPDLPSQVQADIETLTRSPVTTAATQGGGFSPGLAARLVCADGSRIFLKGIPIDHALYDRYREEAAISQALPGAVPVPRLHRAWKSGTWWLMAFDDIDGRQPDLTPGSPDIARALELLDRLPRTVTPSPIPDAPAFVTAVGDELCGWQHLAEAGAELDPWATRHLAQLAATERDWQAHGHGNTLLHSDLRPDNMLLTRTHAVAIDWAYLHQGAAWADPGFFLPHLIRAGHTPAQAEALMAGRVTAWANAPQEAIPSFAIALTGYWERCSRLPAPPQVPYLRPYQAQMAAIGRTWVQHRTGWALLPPGNPPRSPRYRLLRPPPSGSGSSPPDSF